MSHRALVASSLTAFALAFVGTAQAQEACGDTTCPKGWECQTEEAPCPAIDCAEGSDCPVCEPTTVEACRPAPCTSDADCDPAMRCVTEQHSVCTGGEAAPCAVPDGGDPECPQPEPPDCTLETVSACLPSYVLPCESASDCGAGFTCEAEEDCSCTGSGGSAGSGGARPAPEDLPDAGDAFVPVDAAADPVPPEECNCQPTGTHHCVAVKAACKPETVAADCPSGWSCEDNPEGVCSSGPEGTSCTPADPPQLCAPPFSDLGGGGRAEDGGDDGGSTGGAVDGGTVISVDAGTEPPTSGSAGRSGNAAADGDDEPMSSDSGGCSVTRPADSSTGALVGFLLGALGLALARRRR